MILIAHRGNIMGPSPEQENKPHYIETAIKYGYDVEIDLWSDGVQFWLGHNQPDILIDRSFLYRHINRLWCHAKNPQTLAVLLDLQMHCFYHVDDRVTLTSKNFIWTHPDSLLTLYDNSICVLPPRGQTVFGNIHGVCSDYVGEINEYR